MKRNDNIERRRKVLEEEIYDQYYDIYYDPIMKRKY